MAPMQALLYASYMSELKMVLTWSRSNHGSYLVGLTAQLYQAYGFHFHRPHTAVSHHTWSWSVTHILWSLCCCERSQEQQSSRAWWSSCRSVQARRLPSQTSTPPLHHQHLVIGLRYAQESLLSFHWPNQSLRRCQQRPSVESVKQIRLFSALSPNSPWIPWWHVGQSYCWCSWIGPVCSVLDRHNVRPCRIFRRTVLIIALHSI